MQRIKEEFLEKLERIVSLQDASVLEVGCGNGARSADIARRCRTLVAIDPDNRNIAHSRSRNIPNATFALGKAEDLDFERENFDVVIFTLSLHHVPRNLMRLALDQAVRVVKREGFIVVLEPGMEGSFFDAEIQFGACDGDERAEKKAAYEATRTHEKIRLLKEIPDETAFRFDSVEDFNTSMMPQKNLQKLTIS